MKGLKFWAVATSIGMFIVLVMGAVVTKTDSGDACGTDWPLCNGKFIPAYTLSTLIEWSHRFVSGIVGLLVLAVFIWVLVRLRQRKDAVLYAFCALLLTVVQAFLGAAAVMWPQSDLVMALHFGISLLAFAFTLLLAITVMRLNRPARADGWGETYHGLPVIRRPYRILVWVSLIYTYIVVYLGAYVRHTESMSGCSGWPLCNGAVIPDLTNESVLNVFLHRISAALLFVLLAILAAVGVRQYGKSRLLRKVNVWVFWLMAAQVLSGALVTFALRSEDAHLFTSLLHSTLIAGLFGVLCYLGVLTWPRGGKRHVEGS